MTDTIKPIERWTEKERLWVQSYMRHGNKARAVREAGYDVDPDDRQMQAVIGGQIADKPHIAAAIEGIREELMARYEVTQENILAELAKVAFLNIGDLYERDEQGRIIKDDDGAPTLNLTEVPDHVLAALQAIEVTSPTDKTAGKVKVTAHSKLAALELLGKYAKMFTDRVEVTGAVDPVEALRAARKRANLELDHEPTRQDYPGDPDGTG